MIEPITAPADRLAVEHAKRADVGVAAGNGAELFRPDGRGRDIEDGVLSPTDGSTVKAERAWVLPAAADGYELPAGRRRLVVVVSTPADDNTVEVNPTRVGVAAADGGESFTDRRRRLVVAVTAPAHRRASQIESAGELVSGTDRGELHVERSVCSAVTLIAPAEGRPVRSDCARMPCTGADGNERLITPRDARLEIVVLSPADCGGI